jgi:hypothetical protein
MRHSFNILLKFWIVQIPWDIEEFYREHVLAGRDKKRIKFPNPSLGAFSDPLTLVDKKGRIVLWYLPDLLSKDQQVSVSFLEKLEISDLFEIGQH